MQRKVSNIPLLAALALIGAGTSAMAADVQDEDKIHVSYADLNIHSDAGARVLYSRLKRATEKACGRSEYFRTRSLNLSRQISECQKETLDEMVLQVDSEALAKLHST